MAPHLAVSPGPLTPSITCRCICSVKKKKVHRDHRSALPGRLETLTSSARRGRLPRIPQPGRGWPCSPGSLAWSTLGVEWQNGSWQVIKHAQSHKACRRGSFSSFPLPIRCGSFQFCQFITYPNCISVNANPQCVRFWVGDLLRPCLFPT